MNLFEFEDEPGTETASAVEAVGSESAVEAGVSSSDNSSGGESGSGASATDETPSSSATASAVAPASASSPEPIKEESEKPWFDTFGWDDWDGDIDSFPQEHRSLAERFHGHYQPKVKSAEESYDSLQNVYDALLQGSEDPRVGTLTTERDLLKTAASQAQADFANYRRAVEQQADDEATQWVAQFNMRHADVLKDEKTKQAVLGFINSDWDPDLAVQLVSMPAPIQKTADNFRKQGVPQHHAVRFALLEARGSGTPPVSVPRPRSSAQVTAGAEGDSKVGDLTMIDPMKHAGTMDDIRNLAAHRALNKKRGRRK